MNPARVDREEGLYPCPDCGEMIAPRPAGTRRTHVCRTESVTHRHAKMAVVDGFNEARRARRPYKASLPCPVCGIRHEYDLTKSGFKAFPETTVVPGTRSDVVIHRAVHGPPVVVEIVVAHDIDDRTRRRYRAAGTPVLKVGVERGDRVAIERLRAGLPVVHEALNVNRKAMMCVGCR